VICLRPMARAPGYFSRIFRAAGLLGGLVTSAERLHFLGVGLEGRKRGRWGPLAISEGTLLNPICPRECRLFVNGAGMGAFPRRFLGGLGGAVRPPSGIRGR